MFKRGENRDVPLSEEQKQKQRTQNMLDVFGDSVLIYYLSEIFNKDYNFTRRLEKGGHLHNVAQYKKDLEGMPAVAKVDGQTEFNKLAQRLEDYRSTVNASIETDTAAVLEKDIVKYFSSHSSVKIFLDVPGANAEKGYYFNWDTGVLKFLGDDGTEQTVGTLQDLKMKEVLFGNLNPDKKTWFGGTRSRSQKHSASISLTSDLFIEIYENMDISSSAKFHKTIPQDFMDTFFKLRSLNKTNAALAHLKKYRGQTLTALAEELVPDLQRRAEEFLNSHSKGPDGSDESKRYTIMQAINQFANGEIDKAQLTSVVAENDRSWFGKWFHWTDDVDKALAIINRLDSGFLKRGVEIYRKAKDPVKTADTSLWVDYEYEERPSDSPMYDEGIRRYWEGTRISAKAYQKSLNSMLETLTSLETDYGENLQHQISLPASLSDSLIDDDHPDTANISELYFDDAELSDDEQSFEPEESVFTSQEEDSLDETFGVEHDVEIDFRLSDNVSQDGTKDIENTLCGHLRGIITKQLDVVNGYLASEEKGRNFSSNCAELQQVINKILAQRFKQGQRTIYYENTQYAYNEIGYALTDGLKGTERLPAERTEVIVVPDDVRLEILRLIKRCDAIQVQLSKFEDSLIAIGQGTFQTDIREFVTGNLARTKELLEKIHKLTEPCTNEAFDINRATGNQLLIVKAMNTVEAMGNDLTDELSALLKYQKQDKSGKDELTSTSDRLTEEREATGTIEAQRPKPIPRTYKSTDRKLDKERQGVFNKLNQEIDKYLSDTFISQGEAHFKKRENKIDLSKMFVASPKGDQNKHQPSSPVEQQLTQKRR